MFQVQAIAFLTESKMQAEIMNNPAVFNLGACKLFPQSYFVWW